MAKAAASSLVLKLSPQTWRASRHWWKLGVAWLYFSPFTMELLMTTLGGGEKGRGELLGEGARMQPVPGEGEPPLQSRPPGSQVTKGPPPT